MAKLRLFQKLGVSRLIPSPVSSRAVQQAINGSRPKIFTTPTEHVSNIVELCLDDRSNDLNITLNIKQLESTTLFLDYDDSLFILQTFTKEL